MDNKAIRSHHEYALTGTVPGIDAIESQFKNGPDHGKPARGTMLDSQRGATKSGKINHGDNDYDDK